MSYIMNCQQCDLDENLLDSEGHGERADKCD